MQTTNEYELPLITRRLFNNNCYLTYTEDSFLYQYIFEIFDKNDQLPKDDIELVKLSIALIKFHHDIFQMIDGTGSEYEINTDPFYDLELEDEIDIDEFINYCYERTDLLSLLSKNFEVTELFILFVIFLYDYDNLRDYYEANDTDYDDIIVGVGDYQDYLQIINDDMICSDMLNNSFYIEEYGYIYQEINELIG